MTRHDTLPGRRGPGPYIRVRDDSAPLTITCTGNVAPPYGIAITVGGLSIGGMTPDTVRAAIRCLYEVMHEQGLPGCADCARLSAWCGQARCPYGQPIEDEAGVAGGPAGPEGEG